MIKPFLFQEEVVANSNRRPNWPFDHVDNQQEDQSRGLFDDGYSCERKAHFDIIFVNFI